MKSTNIALFSKIKYYRQISKEMQAHLSRLPEDYAKFQNIFNLSVNRVYQDIMEFERENIYEFENNIYKLKKIFEKRYRRHFLCGEFIKWSFTKPFGYAGDFKIIDDIYRNQPATTGTWKRSPTGWYYAC